MVNNREQGSCDWAAGAAVRAAVKSVIRKKAVIRVSCFVFRENLGIRAGLRRAPGNGLVSCLVKTLAALGSGGFVVSSRHVPDGRG